MTSTDQLKGPAVALHIPGWQHVYSGKVRDLYQRENADGEELLVVVSDRISAYDHVLPSEIPGKGIILTQLSLWWFDRLADIVPNHVVSTEVPASVAGRAMICRNLDMFPVECVARGYLTGSGLAEYRATGEVCGLPLPPGLTEASRLAQPIFTPARKAEVGDHDENISFEAVTDVVGSTTAAELRDLTLQVYHRAHSVALERGIILADTKLEFGRDPRTGDIVLGDEVLTPDSSRFWEAASWAEGQAQASFDKQFLRDWLRSPAAGWDPAGDTAPPPLPADVVARTQERYVQAWTLLTGRPSPL